MFVPRLLFLAVIASAAFAQAPFSIRVLLGATDTESKSWDGGVRVEGAKIDRKSVV